MRPALRMVDGVAVGVLKFCVTVMLFFLATALTPAAPALTTAAVIAWSA